MIKKLSIWMARFSLFGMMSYNLWLFFELKNIINKNSKIRYEFIAAKVEKGGRGGNSYRIKVAYNSKEYEAMITSKIYWKIDQGTLPELYYANFGGFVFSKWEVHRRLRLSLLAMLGFGCMFIPITEIEKKLRG